ncbi:MAG TPA: PSD1 and planctomycete cytochrome C domain-containing protein [Planctomicrobium sp.]|nr:PSD1 and planctomycete cytochrome C domain-containing protein [Planctomicrobium sp.]
MSQPRLLVLVFGIVTGFFCRHALGADRHEVDFIRDVRPILSSHCFRCHGPDEGTREAGLRLDTVEGATEDFGGYRAIQPGDPELSEAIKRILHKDPDLRMPPPDAAPPLEPAQVDVLRRWIQQGAIYKEHWAFHPLSRPPVPVSKSPSGARWGHNAIDAFILEKLAGQGLPPSSEANRETLIRRVFLDVSGLPPSLEEIDTYLKDAASDAYERMVERALASPHYGERWGRHWLDQARYADTHGYTVDTARSMWPYRDWVINALNEDRPFDQFTIEQLAGDLLPQPTQKQLIATGFHRNTLMNQEGGVDNEQFRVETVVDRVNTTGAVWLGLTVACAQCHTHKYDPLTHREYYQLYAFFNSSEDVNNVGPTVRLIQPDQQQKLEEFDIQIRLARDALEDYDRQKKDMWLPEEQDDGIPVQWIDPLSVAVRSEEGMVFRQLEDGSFLAEGSLPRNDTYHVSFSTPLKEITGVQLEALTDPSLPQGGPGRAGNGNFVLTDLRLTSENHAVQWLHSQADHSQENFPVADAIDDNQESGWAINVRTGRLNVDRVATFLCKHQLDAENQPLTLTMQFTSQSAGYLLGRFRIRLTDAPLMKLSVSDEERRKLEQHLEESIADRKKLTDSFPTSMIMRELNESRPTHILIRGDFLRQGEPVLPDTPAFLPPVKQDPARTSLTRLDLAGWLVSPDNPLTPRVYVNRVWSHYFGRGLVETENDFGIQGAFPTHPELLDWLASEFVDSGWSMKHVHRLILTSATYRQSSRQRDDLNSQDPINLLLARQSRLRVEAEIVRDLGLAASGLLHRQMGGPSVYPPQPDGVYAFTQSKMIWPTNEGDQRYRRGLYTFFRRSAPYPLLTTFDSPPFNTTCTARVRSNTPLQALTLANDPAMSEIATALGRHLQQAAGEDNSRIEYGFRRCLGRLPDDVERDRLTRYLKSCRNQTSDEQTVWTHIARVLMNLDEFITRE